jgi:hypothetical protein
VDSRRSGDAAPAEVRRIGRKVIGDDRVRLLAAVVGSSSVVAMSALGVAWNAKDPGHSQLNTARTMSTGATSTQKVAPPTPATPVAVPKITGPAAKAIVDPKYYPSYAPPNE